MIATAFTNKHAAIPVRVDIPNENKSAALVVTVVFTTPRYSLRALRRAAELAEGLGCTIRILVPEVTPFPLPLTSPPVCRDFRDGQLRTLASHSSIATRVQVVLCRDPLDGLSRTLRSGSPVLIGGPKRRWTTKWWPAKEERLANALNGLGHKALFISE